MVDGSSSIENFGPGTFEKQTVFAADLLTRLPAQQAAIVGFGYPRGECKDTAGGATDRNNKSCEVYTSGSNCGEYDDDDFKSRSMCCGCQIYAGAVRTVGTTAFQSKEAAVKELQSMVYPLIANASDVSKARAPCADFLDHACIDDGKFITNEKYDCNDMIWYGKCLRGTNTSLEKDTFWVDTDGKKAQDMCCACGGGQRLANKTRGIASFGPGYAQSSCWSTGRSCNTPIAEALDHTRDLIKGKADLDTVIVFITDGKSCTGNLDDSANKLKAMADKNGTVDVFSVGFGSASQSELLKIASNPTNVLKQNSVDLLQTKITELTERLCGDKCPHDPLKTEPGICGCGHVDHDLDLDVINGQELLSVTSYRACAITSQKAFCWSDSGATATPSPSGHVWESVNAGKYHACGIKVGGTGLCWGKNDYGETIFKNTTQKWLSLSGGYYQTCGVTAAGEASCWGYGSSNWGTIPQGKTWTYIDLGINSYITCGLTTDREALCWGKDIAGHAGPPSGVRFVRVSSGADHVCGITTTGNMACWGEKGKGQLTVPVGPRWVALTLTLNLNLTLTLTLTPTLTLSLTPGGLACRLATDTLVVSPPIMSACVGAIIVTPRQRCQRVGSGYTLMPGECSLQAGF